MSVEARTVAFLMALHDAFAPPRGLRHVLYAAPFQDDDGQFRPMLFLQMAAHERVEPIHIQERDLEKSPEQLTSEVAEIIRRARDVKRAAIAKEGNPQ